VGTITLHGLACVCYTHGSKYDHGSSAMSEPMYLMGDDVALGINQSCDDCDETSCVCFEPDRMTGDDE